MQDVEKAKDKGVQIDGGVELVTADVTKGAEYASPASESLCKTLLIHDARAEQLPYRLFAIGSRQAA